MIRPKQWRNEDDTWARLLIRVVTNKNNTIQTYSMQLNSKEKIDISKKNEYHEILKFL